MARVTQIKRKVTYTKTKVSKVKGKKTNGTKTRIRKKS